MVEKRVLRTDLALVPDGAPLPKPDVRDPRRDGGPPEEAEGAALPPAAPLAPSVNAP